LVKKAKVGFEQFALGDDTLFNYKLLPHIKRISHVSDALYNYVQRLNSNVYTAAKKRNLARCYADVFAALLEYYQSIGCCLRVMPIYAYTRLRSVLFYSRLAGMKEDDIVDSIAEGFKDKEIANYLCDISSVDDYAKINGFSFEVIEKIKSIMRAASENPYDLVGVVIE
jgi:beta-glucosidase/6-phospho-beta-glucosidase/beta-galactosidase